MKKLVLFLNYYAQKRLRVILGLHHTSNPLNLRWRWHYWRQNYERDKKKRSRPELR